MQLLKCLFFALLLVVPSSNAKSKLPIPASKSVQFSFTHSLFSPFLFLYKTHNDIDIGFGISRSGGDGVMVGAPAAIPVQCNKIDNSKMHAHTFPFLYLWISCIYIYAQKAPTWKLLKRVTFFSLFLSHLLLLFSFFPFDFHSRNITVVARVAAVLSMHFMYLSIQLFTFNILHHRVKLPFTKTVVLIQHSVHAYMAVKCVFMSFYSLLQKNTWEMDDEEEKRKKFFSVSFLSLSFLLTWFRSLFYALKFSLALSLPSVKWAVWW